MSGHLIKPIITVDMHNWIGNDSSCEDQRSTTDFSRDPQDTRERERERNDTRLKELEQEREDGSKYSLHLNVIVLGPGR